MNNSSDKNLQIELRERIKELACLHEVVRISAQRLDDSIDEVLRDVVQLLPPAWQFSEIAQARIVYNSIEYKTLGYTGNGAILTTNIVIGGNVEGLVEVNYEKECPMAFEGPFLKDERKLLDAFTAEISGVIERHKVREEKTRLEDQIRHADRLATIGQLAAGVAHELNEPLSNILGFAQLALKTDQLPESAALDIKKIVLASMHARNVVSKLRLFACQMPSRQTQININAVVKDGLYFTEAQCSKQQIILIKKLSPNLPAIIADAGQIYQVLTNLTVNAMQAMPKGGKLIIETWKDDNWIFLSVSDNGCGIRPEIRSKIFLPFFTTKEVDQGTGLGLSVVEGIIATHNGSIKVISNLDKGTVFEVKLPIVDEL